MIGIDPSTITALPRLLSTALYSDGAVGTRNGWKALRDRSRPTHIVVWKGTKAIMVVDMLNKTVDPLTHKAPSPQDKGSITKILEGSGIEAQFVPAKKGISV